MAYRVSKVKRPSGPQFKIRFEWFEAGTRKSRDVPKEKWANHSTSIERTWKNNMNKQIVRSTKAAA